MATDSRKYSIAPDEHYGWRTGFTSHGHQVLATDVGHLYFDKLGVFLRAEPQPVHCDWRERASELIANAATIQVREFQLPELEIGVKSMPDRYAAFMRDPTAYSEDEHSRYLDEIASWNEDELFVFQLGDVFWMNSDGTVNSH